MLSAIGFHTKFNDVLKKNLLNLIDTGGSSKDYYRNRLVTFFLLINDENTVFDVSIQFDFCRFHFHLELSCVQVHGMRKK